LSAKRRPQASRFARSPFFTITVTTESKSRQFARAGNGFLPTPSPLKERGTPGVRLINNLLASSERAEPSSLN